MVVLCNLAESHYTIVMVKYAINHHMYVYTHTHNTSSTTYIVVVENKYLNLITNIDDKGMWNRFHSDPCPILAHLKALDMVRQEDGETSRVRVSRKAEGELRLRALRIVVHSHAGTHLPPKCFFKGCLF